MAAPGINFALPKQRGTAQPMISAGKSFESNEDFIAFDLSDDDAEPESSRRHLAPGRAAVATHRDGRSKGRKRRLDDGPGGSATPCPVDTLTPWCAGLQANGKTAAQMLSAEVASFVHFIQPRPEEHELRQFVIESIRRVIRSDWRDASIHAFGSYATRLYLPDGDIDLVILSREAARRRPKDSLYALSSMLQRRQVAKEVVVIASARVPIVKFKSVHGNYNVDISINQATGLESLDAVSELLDETRRSDSMQSHPMNWSSKKGKGKATKYNDEDTREGEVEQCARRLGAARCLIFVIKALLQQRGMNEVFTGGLGSYSVTCLVVSFLQMHPLRRKGKIDSIDQLGTLLVDFLKLYGHDFDYHRDGICVRRAGHYFDKVRRGWERPGKPCLLTIEDPANPDNDISVGSYNIDGVKNLLDELHQRLSTVLSSRQSLLSTTNSETIKTASAAPHTSTEQHNGDSLLGLVVGVTQQTLNFRRENLLLFQSATIQKVLGIRSWKQIRTRDIDYFCGGPASTTNYHAAKEATDERKSLSSRISTPKKKKNKEKEINPISKRKLRRQRAEEKNALQSNQPQANSTTEQESINPARNSDVTPVPQPQQGQPLTYGLLFSPKPTTQLPQFSSDRRHHDNVVALSSDHEGIGSDVLPTDQDSRYVTNSTTKSLVQTNGLNDADLCNTTTSKSIEISASTGQVKIGADVKAAMWLAKRAPLSPSPTDTIKSQSQPEVIVIDP